MPQYHHDLGDHLTASARVHGQKGILLIDQGCRFACDFCQYTFSNEGRYDEVPFEKIVEDLDRLNSYGIRQVLVYSAAPTLHSSIDGIIGEIEARGIEPFIEDARLTRLGPKNRVLATMINYNHTLVMPMDAASYRIRNIIGKTGVTNELAAAIAKQAYEGGLKTFSPYFIINFEGETEEDRREIIELIETLLGLGDDVVLNIFINPIFPQPNTPYERFAMQQPEVTMQRIKEIWEQVKPYAQQGLPGTRSGAYYGRGSSVQIWAISPVYQWIEGITLRGDRKAGYLLYDLHSQGLFKGDYGFGHLQRIRNSLAGIDDQHYFNAIPFDNFLPWEIVRPASVSLRIDARAKTLYNWLWAVGQN